MLNRPRWIFVVESFSKICCGNNFVTTAYSSNCQVICKREENSCSAEMQTTVKCPKKVRVVNLCLGLQSTEKIVFYSSRDPQKSSANNNQKLKTQRSQKRNMKKFVLPKPTRLLLHKKSAKS